MSRALAFLFFMLFLAGFALVMLKNMRSTGVSGPDSTIEQAASTLTGGDWSIKTTRQGKHKTVFVRFLVDGGISGFAGCNSFFGAYVATDTVLEIGQLGATRKACPAGVMRTENRFMQALGNATGYRIKGSTLFLSDAQEKTIELTLGKSGVEEH